MLIYNPRLKHEFSSKRQANKYFPSKKNFQKIIAFPLPEITHDTQLSFSFVHTADLKYADWKSINLLPCILTECDFTAVKAVRKHQVWTSLQALSFVILHTRIHYLKFLTRNGFFHNLHSFLINWLIDQQSISTKYTSEKIKRKPHNRKRPKIAIPIVFFWSHVPSKIFWSKSLPLLFSAHIWIWKESHLLKANVFLTISPIDNVRCESVRCSSDLTVQKIGHQIVANLL